MRKLMLTSIMLGVALTMAAQHELRDLDIQVELADNGDATITETRQMTIGDEGTECYIVIGNLNNSRITSLQVSDETGTTYVTEDGDWNVDRSRSEKANRCGIHHQQRLRVVLGCWHKRRTHLPSSIQHHQPCQGLHRWRWLQLHVRGRKNQTAATACQSHHQQARNGNQRQHRRHLGIPPLR